MPATEDASLFLTSSSQLWASGIFLLPELPRHRSSYGELTLLNSEEPAHSTPVLMPPGSASSRLTLGLAQGQLAYEFPGTCVQSH